MQLPVVPADQARDWWGKKSSRSHLRVFAFRVLERKSDSARAPTLCRLSLDHAFRADRPAVAPQLVICDSGYRAKPLWRDNDIRGPRSATVATLSDSSSAVFDRPATTREAARLFRPLECRRRAPLRSPPRWRSRRSAAPPRSGTLSARARAAAPTAPGTRLAATRPPRRAARAASTRRAWAAAPFRTPCAAPARSSRAARPARPARSPRAAATTRDTTARRRAAPCRSTRRRARAARRCR